MNTSAYLFAQTGFIVLTVVFAVLLLVVVKRGLSRTDIDTPRQRSIFRVTCLGLALWLIVTGIVSSTGFFSDFSTFPPRMVIVVIVPLMVMIWILNNRTATIVIREMSGPALLGLQGFRVLVEILLWRLFVAGLLPEQMTFEGRNFDILAGLTGPIMAWLVYKQKVSRGIVIAWNFICFGLLINIVTIAILSMPTPMRVFMNEPANTVVTLFPIIWLPAFLVPLAYTLHLFALKKYWSSRATAESKRQTV